MKQERSDRDGREFIREAEKPTRSPVLRSALGGASLIMPPTGSETDERNFNLIGQLWALTMALGWVG